MNFQTCCCLYIKSEQGSEERGDNSNAIQIEANTDERTQGEKFRYLGRDVFTEIKERYQEEFSAWAGNPLKYSPIEGESTVEVEKRVMKAVNRILKKHKGDEIAIVSHGGVSRIILCRLLGIPLENIFRIEQDYAAVNIIEFWDKYPVVKLINGAVNV